MALIHYQFMGRVASPKVKPLARRTTGELVAEHVRGLIFHGELRPGDRIPQAEIADDLGVSRLPVREAVIELARDGLVEMEPHSGAFVAPFDAEVIRQHFEIVGLVQGIAAESLVERPDPEALARLRDLTARIDAATLAGDGIAVHEFTMELLRVLNLAGGSVRQQAVLRALARMLPTGFFAEVPGAAESERRGAHMIVEAVESGSRSRARTTCVEVQRMHAELLVEHLYATGVFGDPPSPPVVPSAPTNPAA
jgi:DNA-binding GntR family transcriptional regulator